MFEIWRIYIDCKLRFSKDIWSLDIEEDERFIHESLKRKFNLSFTKSVFSFYPYDFYRLKPNKKLFLIKKIYKLKCEN